MLHRLPEKGAGVREVHPHQARKAEVYLARVGL